jgi:hypothetical protein
MKFLIYRFQCGSCRHWFEHHQMTPVVYGEFLMRSETRRTERYLNAITDPVYEEVDRLLRFETRVGSRSERERAEILQSLFGVACDPDEDGGLFQMNLLPRCPDCGAEEIADYASTEPPRIVDLEIPHVTHDQWNALNQAEKLRVLENELQQRGV